jgi:hypothetical protein
MKAEKTKAKLRCGERCDRFFDRFFFYVDGNNSSGKEKKG